LLALERTLSSFTASLDELIRLQRSHGHE